MTARQLINHLDANCGGLHPSELVNLPTDMMGYYSQADGIPEYINMLKEAQCKLARANLPMLDNQLLAIASMAILASSHFPRLTDDREACTCVDKMWHIAHKCRMLASGMTTGVANAVTVVEDATISDVTFAKLNGYLDNLAPAATTEKHPSPNSSKTMPRSRPASQLSPQALHP